MALRKNQSTLSAAEKTAFVEAVLAQKQRPSLLHPGGADRTRYDDFVEVHHPIDMLDHRTIGISYDTDPVAAPPVMAPAVLPVTAPEEPVPVRRRTVLPMFVLPREIAVLERTWS